MCEDLEVKAKLVYLLPSRGTDISRMGKGISKFEAEAKVAKVQVKWPVFLENRRLGELMEAIEIF